MAYLELMSTTEYSVTVRFRQLSQPKPDYMSFRFELNGALLTLNASNYSFYSDGTGYYRTESITLSGLDCDTSYRLYAEVRMQNGSWYDVGGEGGAASTRFRTDPCAIVDLEYPIVTVFGTITSTTIPIIWDRVVGAIAYYVYLDGVYKGQTGTNVSAREWTFAGLQPNREYCFYVTAWNGTNESNTGVMPIT